jgi:KR domain
MVFASLHNALKGIDLDFFAMTSSISAVLGNTGQSNYSAANGFLDTLALHRNTKGLAGTSLVLPMVLDVGVVAENDSIEASLMRKGLYRIYEPEMLRGFEVAMSKPRPTPPLGGDLPEISKAMESQLVMGMEVRELFRSINAVGAENADLYWYNDARFCHIRDALEASTGGNGSGGDESFVAALKSAQSEGLDTAIEAIAAHIMKRMSGILIFPIESFEMDGASLASYGLDSMIGAEMRTWLFKEFGLD